MLVAFAQDQTRRGLRPATITTRRRILWSLERHLPGPIELATSDEIEKWLDSLRLSSRSRYTYLSATASFFEFIRRRGVRPDDPTRDILRPRLNRLIPRPMTPADAGYAIANADAMMAAWLSLCAYQGLRCFEIAQLRREDVLDNREPPLLVVADGKGGRQDILTLNQQVELALHHYGMPRNGFLFVTRDGLPYKPASVSRYICKHMAGLGIDGGAHRLRHLFISAVWSQTKDLRVTQEVARHSDPKTTSGYAAFDSDLAAKVVRGLRLQRAGQLEHLPFEPVSAP